MSDLFLGHRTGGGSSKTDISTATVTLQTQSFTYDGTIKTRNVSSVILNGQTLTAGTDYVVLGNKAIDAGTHHLVVKGAGNYDGIVSADWNISKAQGSISVSPISLSLMDAGSTDTVTISKVGDGAVSVQSSNSSVATVEVDGNTITVTSVSNGSTTITITLSAGINYTGDSATISVSVIIPSATLSDNTPAQILYAAQADIASTLWNVGDKTAEISIGAVGNMSATSACAFIIGFDHNSDIEGSGIHFQFGKTSSGKDIAFVDSGIGTGAKTSGTWFNMNNTQTNSGGWASSRMRTVICPAFLSALPNEWQNVIKGCKKWTNNTGDTSESSAITETTDNIFLLAEQEVFGIIEWANSYESKKQKQYTYYANGNSKVKNRHNSTPPAYTATGWWLRSARIGYSGYFVDVSGSDADFEGAYYSEGFAPGFVIG